jgi:hypothetical protein
VTRTSITRMSTTLLLCGALALTACSSTESAAPANTPGSNPSTTAPNRPSSAAAVSAGDLCGYLRGRLPVLRAIGSEVGRMGNLTVNLYSWYEKQGTVPPTGAQIDDQTKKECPDIRAELLKISGMRSFATL